jgi:ABC-type multidrug transport system fused ATPase/permease subunit
MHHRSTAPSPQQQGGITPSQLWTMLKPWRGWLALVGVSVLLGAVLELVPPLLVKKIVDEQLVLGRSEGLLWIAVSYLGATAAVQVMGVYDRVSYGHHCSGHAPKAAGAPLRPSSDITIEL